ncbi:hypothetical protein T492DRAFT_1017529 [Pavlovales sp. CCMP2436]|nr:hypothetical protein T492DRAFT_1017529 [Pavlovales sp. CCMP2436]
MGAGAQDLARSAAAGAHPCPVAYYFSTGPIDASAPMLQAALGWNGRVGYSRCARCPAGCAKCLSDGQTCTECLTEASIAEPELSAPPAINGTGEDATNSTELDAPASPPVSTLLGVPPGTCLPTGGSVADDEKDFGLPTTETSCKDILEGRGSAPPRIVAQCRCAAEQGCRIENTQIVSVVSILAGLVLLFVCALRLMRARAGRGSGMLRGQRVMPGVSLGARGLGRP